MGDDKGDIKPGRFPKDLKWPENEAAASLEMLYKYVNDECDRATRWYFVKKRTMKHLGHIFRIY